MSENNFTLVYEEPKDGTALFDDKARKIIERAFSILSDETSHTGVQKTVAVHKLNLRLLKHYSAKNKMGIKASFRALRTMRFLEDSIREPRSKEVYFDMKPNWPRPQQRVVTSAPVVERRTPKEGEVSILRMP